MNYQRIGINTLLACFLLLGTLGFLPPAAMPVHAAPEGEPLSLVVARVFYQTDVKLAELAQWLDIWEVQHDDGVLLALVSLEEVQSLQAAGYQVEIDLAQTAKLYEVRQPLPGQTEGIPAYPCYRTVEETFTSIDDLIAAHPTLVSKVDIGNSWDKVTPGGPAGYDIWEMIITNQATGGNKPKFYLMAEIHAREYTTAETAMRFGEYLVQNYNVNPDITWLLDHYQIHIVPMVNPDGRKKAEAGQSWRKNTNNNQCATGSYGVDLNRNSSFKWGTGGSSSNPCDETYMGVSPSSEPETTAIQLRVASLFPDQRGPNDNDAAPLDYQGLFITLHSYSQLILWPWGHTTTVAPNGVQMQTLGRKMAYFNGYTPEQSVGLYPTSGTTDDWAYGELGMPAYTYEMGTSFFQDCNSFNNTIWPNNRDALLYAFKASRRPYQNPAGPDALNLALSLNNVAPGIPITLTATANDTRYLGGEASQAIQAARYSFDLPSWAGGAVTYPMSAADGTFNSTTENLTAALNTAGLAPGRHTIFVEAQDAAGNWGVPSATFLTLTQPDAGLAFMTPETDTLANQAGTSVVYSLTLTNLGGLTDTFTMTVEGSPAWETLISPAIIPDLAPGTSATVTVTVNIPESANGSDVAIIKATPSNPSFADTSTITTQVSWVSVSPETLTGEGEPGTNVTYTIYATNHGSGWLTYDVEISGNNWGVTTIPTLIGMQAGETKPITVTVSIPTGLAGGEMDTVTIKVVTRSNRSMFDLIPIVTTAIGGTAVYGVELNTTFSEKNALVGEMVTYEVTIHNSGNRADTFDIAVSGSAWVSDYPLTTGLIQPDASETVTITMMVPNAAPPGSVDGALVTVTSQSDGSKSDQVTLTTTALGKIMLPMIINP